MRDVRAAVVGQALSSGGQLALTVVAVKVLGLESFGRLALVLAGAGYAAGLVQALLAQPFLSAGAPGERRRGMVLLTGLLAAGAAAAIWLGSAVLGQTWLFAGAAAVTCAGRAVVPVLRALCLSEGRTRSLYAVDAGALLAALAMGVSSSVSAGGALALLAAGTWAGLSAAFLGGARRWLSAGGAPLEDVRWFWARGRWLAATQVASWFGTGGFLAALTAGPGAAAVGALRAAQTLVAAPLALVQALDLALPGRAHAVLLEGGPLALGAWMRRGILVLAIPFAVAGAVVPAFLAEPCRWLVGAGADHLDVLEALGWLAFLPACAVLTGLVTIALRAVERTEHLFVCYLASSLLAAAVAAPLVGGFGVAGAAAGLVGCQVLYGALLLGAWSLATGGGTGAPLAGGVNARP